MRIANFRYRIGCSFSPHGSNDADVTAAAVGEVKDVRGIRIADITLAVFTFCNSLRFLAYVPQIAGAVRDQSGAQAISLGTWGLFFISHAWAMAYALVNNEDWIMAFMFLANAIGCGAVLLITAWKRSQHRSRTRQYEPTPTVLGVLARKMGSSIRKARLRRTFSRKKTGSWTDGPLSGF